MGIHLFLPAPPTKLAHSRCFEASANRRRAEFPLCERIWQVLQ